MLALTVQQRATQSLSPSGSPKIKKTNFPFRAFVTELEATSSKRVFCEQVLRQCTELLDYPRLVALLPPELKPLMGSRPKPVFKFSAILRDDDDGDENMGKEDDEGMDDGDDDARSHPYDRIARSLLEQLQSAPAVSSADIRNFLEVFFLPAPLPLLFSPSPLLFSSSSLHNFVLKKKCNR